MKPNPTFYTPVKVNKTYQTIEVKEGDDIVQKTYLIPDKVSEYIQNCQSKLYPSKKPTNGKTITEETFWVTVLDSEGQQHSSLVDNFVYDYIDMLESKLLDLKFDVKSLIKPPPHDEVKAKKIKDFYEKMEKVYEWKKNKKN